MDNFTIHFVTLMVSGIDYRHWTMYSGLWFLTFVGWLIAVLAIVIVLPKVGLAKLQERA
jgi:hypothetical protein